MSYDQLKELPYLSACISEGFRMDPVTGLILSREVPTGGVEMSGYYIPAGVSSLAILKVKISRSDYRYYRLKLASTHGS